MRTVKEVGRNYTADIDIPSASIDFTTVGATANTTLSDDSGLITILVSCSTADITLTLPAASGNQASFNIIKVDSTAYKVIIDPNASETIDGASTIYIYDQWDHVQIQSDDTNWVINNNSLNQKWT